MYERAQQIEGEWVEVELSNRHVQQVGMQVTIDTNIIGNISFIYIFDLILTSIKLYISLKKKLSTLSLKFFFSAESNKLST